MVDTPKVVVDTTGISAPSVADWTTYLQEQFKDIYGQDIYLGNDSQDGQLIGIFAQALADTGDSAVAVYNDFSPATAQGAGLDSVIKVNGLKRQIPTRSTVVVTVTGPVGGTITNGIATDNLNLGTTWSLPASVVIPSSGAIDVTATCTVDGAVTAGPGTITGIATPQPNWQSVTNAAAAVPGAPVEADPALRSRQSRSAALPADTTLNGIYAAVADVTGVQRAEVYQNDFNTTDDNGILGHYIAVVVEGGDTQAVASAIALKKPPGIGMMGDITETVFDARGVPKTIKFYALRLVGMHVLLFLAPLAGYVSTTADLITKSLAQYFNDQSIGEDSYRDRVYSPANLTGASAQTMYRMVMGISPSISSDTVQAQLDALSNTYHITQLAQGDDDMVVTGGPYGAGSTTVNIVSTVDIPFGSVMFINLDDLSHFQVVVTNVAGTAVTFTPAIPTSRSAQNGAQVYVVGDVTVFFTEASQGLEANVIIETAA